MLLALMQSLGMGGSPFVPAVIEGGGTSDDVKAPKKRRRGDRDHRWLHDPMWESIRLEREVMGVSRAREEEIEEVLDATEIVSDSLGAVGGLSITPPPPPPPVTQALLRLDMPDYSEVIAAIKDAHRRERDRKMRAEIMDYRVRVERLHREAIHRRRDEEDVAEMLRLGIL